MQTSLTSCLSKASGRPLPILAAGVVALRPAGAGMSTTTFASPSNLRFISTSEEPPVTTRISAFSTVTLPSRRRLTQTEARSDRTRRSYHDGAGGSATSSSRSWYWGSAVVAVIIVVVAYADRLFDRQRIWPAEVDGPLRDALKARNRGETERAEASFERAIRAALGLGPGSLGPDPLLKLTGLYIAYASMLELQSNHLKAYTVLRDALSHLGERPVSSPSSPAGSWIGPDYSLTPADHVRAIGISQKLGHLALQISSSGHPPPFPINRQDPSVPIGWLDTAEFYLSQALTAMLKLGLHNRNPTMTTATTTSTDIISPPQEPVIAGRDVDLGSDGEANPMDGLGEGRVDRQGLGMTMEALAEVYTRKKRPELARQLLLQAISILLPAQAKGIPSIQDRCQAAMLMTSLSANTLGPRSAEAIKISRSWSLRSLQIADQAIAETTGNASEISAVVCKRARAVGLHSLGMLSELERDHPAAIKAFEQSLAQAKDIHFAEGKREAMEAVRRLRSGSGVS